jgi:hypothetical protein
VRMGIGLLIVKPQDRLLIYISESVLPRTIHNILLCSTQVAPDVLGGTSGCHI